MDWSFHNLPYAFLETGPVVSLPSPGTSCILDFAKNIDNNPEIKSESPFNSKEAIQLSLENLNWPSLTGHSYFSLNLSFLNFVDLFSWLSSGLWAWLRSVLQFILLLKFQPVVPF